MTTELLIAIQVLVLLLLAVGMLAVLLLKQKKTIARLQQILTDYKDDISGESMARYFQAELDNTTAHCRRETVVLEPDLPPEDMAISLRYIALQTELALVQQLAETKVSWREQIKHYEELGQKIHELIRARVDHATKTLNDSHNQELGIKDQEITQLQGVCDDLQDKLNALKPLRDLLENATSASTSTQEMELLLHRALLALCENYDHTEHLRELAFLMHEAYNHAVITAGKGESPDELAEDASSLPAQDS